MFVCPPCTVPWPALADVPLYVAAAMLYVTLVPASSFGRALWPALVDALLYVVASALFVSPPPVATCNPVLSPALVGAPLYVAAAVLCVDVFFNSACGGAL